MNEKTKVKIIKIEGVRDYIDVMYNDVKPIENGYQMHLQYDGYDIKRVIEYFYKIEQENKQLKEKIKILTKKNASKKIYGEYKNVRLSEKEYISLVECYGQELTTQLITYLDEYIEMKGYKAKSHYLCMKRWVIDAVKNNRYKNTRQPIREEKVPEWFNKDIKSEMATPEEIAELKEMLKGYK